ncbi:MAG: VCBS repeat-containing protein [Bacteroidota bacterium]|nr:VCBS repeat-containing protein [Bacteroidota bacterium]
MKYLFVIIIAFSSLLSCKSREDKAGMHFTMLPSSHTGVNFNNTITENDSVNMFVNEYTYMGGGVGVGDFNRDGLKDVFFAGNQVSSKLYINKGNIAFEDVTIKANVSTKSWCTGVSVIDINNDGWADIYVCVSGRASSASRKNLLFINQHNLTFKEEAAEYGLADTSYSTQAAFFDYDGDGRLDMYLLNHTLNDMQPNNIRDKKIDSNAVAGDKLYHNEGSIINSNHPVFKDVSKQANIVEDGNGLGITVSDFNNDGYPDIYVANDYVRNDLLWLNNRNGTFTNSIATAIRHQSYSSMGTDAADINNDRNADIITLDMQPESNERKKMMYSFLNEQRHQLEMEKGYEPEYIHNMLQLNNGVRTINGQQQPFFSEVGEMAGIAETDWSWSVLIADLDNDGWKDVHIGNGLGRDPTNIDFLEYRHNAVMASGIPDNDSIQRRTFMNHLSSLGEVKLRNYLYRNKGNFTFDDVSEQSGIDKLSISNGAAYVDLDNDGDLDIVTNNINGDAFIMRNDVQKKDDNTSHLNYVTLQLNGDTVNKDGIGTKVLAYCNGLTQMLEQYPVRGYLSTVDTRLHFGFNDKKVDSIVVIWPDSKTQVITHPLVNSILQVNYIDARPPAQQLVRSTITNFTDVTNKENILFHHQESFFLDYAFQPLIQQKYSQEGPFISVGDINGDGREDFFVGGAFKQSGKVFLQKQDGTFSGKDLDVGTKNQEDLQSALFDADGDGDSDLLVVSGSTEFDPGSSFYRPRLYTNDGKGNFKLDEKAISTIVRTPGKALAIADMDGDGDNDIFIGGRVSLGTFPQPVRSYILRNDHGVFTDVTRAVCPQLEEAGLINAALWTDIDKDGKPDLVVAADWAPIRIFKNTGASLKEISSESGLQDLPGFWRSLTIADIDHDGDLDIIAGNQGLNMPYHINPQQPAELVAKDFDNNGMVEPVFCYYIKNNEGNYILSAGISRDEWVVQMPLIKKKFEHNEPYAKASMDEIFTAEMKEGAVTLYCKETRSGYFENNGKGKFSFHPFANEAQIAPVNAVIFSDVDGDGKDDLVLAGNEYQTTVSAGRYDASYGLVMHGNGKGNFTPLPPVVSGLIIDGDVKDLKVITSNKKRILLAAINNEAVKAFTISSH